MEKNERKTSDVQQDQVKASKAAEGAVVTGERHGGGGGLRVKKNRTNPPGGCFY